MRLQQRCLACNSLCVPLRTLLSESVPGRWGRAQFPWFPLGAGQARLSLVASVPPVAGLLF
jgi:hypothetical protein